MAAPVLPEAGTHDFLRVPVPASATAAKNSATTTTNNKTTATGPKKILVLPGDHAGPEVMAEALKVLGVIEDCCPGVTFEATHGLVGGCSIDKHGTPITDDVLKMASESDAVLFGSVGGPEW